MKEKIKESRHCDHGAAIQAVHKEKTLINRLDSGYPAGRPSGMMTTTKAFTLIELLVVVLIIGILAAVALPQYQKAVDKVRFSNLRTMGSSFIQAATEYYLANSTWPDNFSDLAMDMPGGFERVTATAHGRDYECAKNENMFCCVVPKATSNAQAAITCSLADESLAYTYLIQTKGHYCLADPENSAAIQTCKAVSRKTSSPVTNWRLYSPTGYDKVMHYYWLD